MGGGLAFKGRGAEEERKGISLHSFYAKIQNPLLLLCNVMRCNHIM